MLHKLTFIDGYPPTYQYVGFDSVPLKAMHSLVIPALCQGIVPHEFELTTDICFEDPKEYRVDEEKTAIWLVPEPGLMTSRNLIVLTGPIEDGPVLTHVFNLSNEQLRIRKGEVISRLVLVEGHIWEKSE